MFTIWALASNRYWEFDWWFHTCVLMRHLHCLVREPLSRRISKPTSAAESPNMYLPLQNLMRLNINARLKLQIMPPTSRIRIFYVISQMKRMRKIQFKNTVNTCICICKRVGESQEFETGHVRTISPSLNSFPSFSNYQVIPLKTIKIFPFFLQIWRNSPLVHFWSGKNTKTINPVEFFTPNLYLLQIVLYMQLNGSTKTETKLCQ